MIIPLRPFGGAVARNRARRKIREFYRRNRSLFPDGVDLLVRLFADPRDWDRFFEQLTQLAAQIPTGGIGQES